MKNYKYIKNFESFKNHKYDKNRLNEEFLGKMLKGVGNFLLGKDITDNIGDKLSKMYSSKFGSLKKVDELMKSYEEEVMANWSKKRPFLEAINKYTAEISSGAELDAKAKAKYEEIKNKLSNITENIDKQRKIIDDDFGLKFKEIVDNEENKKILNLIKIKKLELDKNILARELDALMTNLSKEDVQNDNFLSEIFGKAKTEIEKKDKEIKEESDILSKEGEETKKEGQNEGDEDVFNFEEAKLNPESYKWEKSPYLTGYDFKPEDKLKVWMFKSNNENIPTFSNPKGGEYTGTELTVDSPEYKNSEDQVESDKISVYFEKGKNFPILKSKIIEVMKK